MEDTVVKVVQSVARRQPTYPALMVKDKTGSWQTITYQQLAASFERFGAGLLDFGVKRGDHVGIIADNRKEWIIADLGILGIGAADVPRGSDTMPDEARFILNHADCALSLAENAEQVKKILSRKSELPALKALIVMDEEFRPEAFTEPTGGLELLTLGRIMERGKALLERDPQAFQREVEKGKDEDLATLIYTSGTTGEPKGVMISHANFLHNLRTTVPHHIVVTNADMFLSVLPVWHSFERTVEYIILRNGAGMAYSKPIGKIMLEDMSSVRPTVMASVPRIWEGVRSAVYRTINEEGGIKRALFLFFVAVGQARSTLSALVRGLYPQFHRRFRAIDFIIAILPFLALSPVHALGNLLVFSKIKQKLGGRFRFTVSGGGALPPYVDRFFQAVGILLLEGYGLTETAPVVSVRLQKRPVIGTIGPLLPEMEAKLLDVETGKPVSPGHKGIIYLKGPNVMKGYYKRPDKTAEVLSPDGWFNTGDLGIETFKGELRIIGRVKETIVLLGGENVEPVPIEDTILESEFIDQVMVVGQDKKYLGALVVPNVEALEKHAAEKGISYVTREDLLEHSQIIELISDEINSRVNSRRGFREFERIFKFRIIPKHFEVGVELTASLKVKRDVVNQIYKKEIDGIFAK
jgi:long-chain acyl-CoA synthetase